MKLCVYHQQPLPFSRCHLSSFLSRFSLSAGVEEMSSEPEPADQWPSARDLSTAAAAHDGIVAPSLLLLVSRL